jgi:pimeloyl-[acyl-carrier protein] methyl ester esterase
MTLHIQTMGKGMDLVLLHGWGMHAGVWDGVRDELAQDFRVHLVDLPGYGQSDSCTPYMLSELARTVANAEPKSVCVCGWSLGAQVALRWALDFPRQVQRLVLVAATPCFVRAADWPSGIEAQVLQKFASDLQRNVRSTLKRFASLQTHGAKNARRYSAWLCKRLFAAADPGVLQAGLRMLRNTDLRQEVRKVIQPVLLLHGEKDGLVPVTSAHWLKQHLNRARLETFKDCAHAPFLAQGRKFVKLVSEFLDE